MLVGFSGSARAGKDTAATRLCDLMQGQVVALADPIKRFLRRAFELRDAQLWGDEKELLFERISPWVEDLQRAFVSATNEYASLETARCLKMERWLQELPRRTTVRHLAQTFGTEVVRAYQPDFWADLGLWAARQLLYGGYIYDRRAGLLSTKDAAINLVAFSDVRFRNEMVKLKLGGGLLFKVERAMAQQGLSQTAKAHRSETEQTSVPEWWFDGVLHNDGTVEQLCLSVEQLAELLWASPVRSGTVASTV